MVCRKLHDSLYDLFHDVDAVQYVTAVKHAYQSDNWSELLGDSRERDQALRHAAECSDCLDDILAYLKICDAVDYRQFPCLHLAYYSTAEDDQCIDEGHGFFTIVQHGKETDGVVVGFCPWCGVSLPTTTAELEETQWWNSRT